MTSTGSGCEYDQIDIAPGLRRQSQIKYEFYIKGLFH